MPQKLKDHTRAEAADAPQAVQAALAEVPFLHVSPVRFGHSGDGDFEFDVTWPAGSITLLCEFKAVGQPGPARNAIASLERRLLTRPNATGVLVAPYITESVSQMCRDHKIGTVDLSGNARLTFGNVYVHRSGNPNRFSERREMRSLFAPKASRVLRVLLENPEKAWTVQALATEAQVSIGQVSHVKQALAAYEWLAPENGVRISRPEEVLRKWSRQQENIESEHVEFYTSRSLEQAQKDLLGLYPQLGKQFALCGLSAAWQYAPMVPPVRLTMFVSWDARETASQSSLKEVPSGGNVVLIRPRDEGVYYPAPHRLPQFPIVGPVQTYLDCMRAGSRGEEAAEAVLEQVIRRWW